VQSSKMKQNHKINRIFWYIVVTIIFGCSTTIVMVCSWAKKTFNVSLNAIINTLLSPLKGTSSDTVIPAIKYCLPMVLLVILICLIYAVWDNKKENKVVRIAVSIASLLSVVFALLYVQSSYDIIGYIRAKGQETSFYKDNYIAPDRVNIQNPEEKRNLLLIYLESMEMTYADVENGGAQEINYMPYSVQLAKDNISFSNTEKTGGIYPIEGATWTMSSLFTSSSGLPFAFPVDANDMEGEASFASGVYTLGDFLAEQGYTQEFLCGSDASFAGRRTFFEQHGNYDIFDLYTAREKGYIAEDYYEWWGFEDEILYKIAKDELLRLSESEEPFNLTMLTVDAHHIGGYVCKLCGDEYENVTANVINCADRQLNEFIEWCKKQAFYEDTTIVLVGDHPRMDSSLVGDISFFERTLYNCFINITESDEINQYNREASMLDMFPTILSGMGYQIDGNRLGLGVNLFSDEKTALEEFGREYINQEFSKSSLYYVERFAPELSYRVVNPEEAVCVIYLGEEQNNAKEYIKEGISECEGEYSWFNAEKMVVEMPILEDLEKVHIKMYILGTARSIPYKVEQGDVVIEEGAIAKGGIVEFDAIVENGSCVFEFRIPYDELEEKYEIEDHRTLKLTHITAELCDE